MIVEGIDHIHLVVRDLDKAKAFYQNVFGVNFTEDKVGEKWGVKGTFGLLGDVTLEILQPISPDSPAAAFLEKRGEGIEAISVKVADIEEAKKEMKALGIRQVAEVSGKALKEVHLHPKDCFGVLFELCEYEKIPPISIAVDADTEDQS